MQTKTPEIHFQTSVQRTGLLKIADLLHRLVHLFPNHIPIFYKISFLLTLLVILCSTTLGAIIVFNQSRIITSQINDLGQTVVNHLARSIREPLLADDKFSMEVLVSSLVTGNNVVGTEILSPEGITLVKSGYSPFDRKFSNLHQTPLDIISRLDQKKNWPWRLNLQDGDLNVISFIAPIYFKELNAGFALVTFSRIALDKSHEQAVKSIALATAFIIFLGITMAFLLGKKLTTPVDRFMTGIKAIDRGDYDFRFNERRNDEIGQLMNAFNHMAEGMLKKNQVEYALDRYLSPSVAKRICTNLDAVKLGGKRIQASMLFADVIGYTSISETMDPEDLAVILNRYFSYITKACELNNGMVDKYMGDCAMLIFGAPEYDEEHSYHAAMCGLLIRKLIEHENGLRLAQGLTPIHFRMGINSGSMLAGNLGSRQRMEYTVVGDAVNLASRLCAAAQENQIVVSSDFYQQIIIRQRVHAHEYISIRLRGMEFPVSTFKLRDMAGEHKERLEKQFQEIISKI